MYYGDAAPDFGTKTAKRRFCVFVPVVVRQEAIIYATFFLTNVGYWTVRRGEVVLARNSGA